MDVLETGFDDKTGLSELSLGSLTDGDSQSERGG